MHDIINMEDHDYKWIDALYKKGKNMIKCITDHSHVHYIFRNHFNLELLKTRFASYYLTFKHVLKVRSIA